MNKIASISYKVSIITPSYNQADYLEETIQSVLSQTYDNIEYIVIDGGSTDNSVEIIKKYADRIDYWVSEPDKGQADAINKGLKKSTGDLVCWINSDDLLYLDFVHQRVNQFIENPQVDFIYGDVEQGKTLEKRFLRRGAQTDFKTMLTTLRVPIPQQSAMWRISIQDKLGYLDAQWHVLLDREYFMRMAMYTNILYIPGVVAFFRNHEQSKSIAEWYKWAAELEKYYTDFFQSTDFVSYIENKRQALSAMYYECYKISRDCGKMHDAKEYIKKSFSWRPFWLIRNEIKRVAVKIKNLI